MNRNRRASMPWQIEKIIAVANGLQATGSSGGSTSEQIAAAFVLNRMELLPEGYGDVVEAWERLDGWQEHVRCIKRHHMHLIEDGPKSVYP